MTITEQVSKEMVDAMKSADKFTLSVLRMLKSALQTEKISKKHELSDEEAISVIKHQVKIRKDSIEEYTKYNRQDLVDNLTKEVEILAKYLPEELSLEAINAGLDEIFAEVNPTGPESMGLIMRKASEKFGSRADMKQVNNLVRERLVK